MPTADQRPSAEAMASRDELQALLQAYNEHPDDRDRILAEIDKRFRRTVAILVLDTCGFSRTVQGKGIVHFLALLEGMERLVRPTVEGAGGRILRREADNVFAVFDSPADAVQAARAIYHDVVTVNEALPADEEVGVSIGIGFGELLLVGEDDAWGDEMNLASKLGEDLARCGEILLTEAAGAAAKDGDVRLEERTFSVSGVDLRAFQLGG